MNDDGCGARVSYSATNSLWFKRFMEGSHKRMGDQWVPDKAISRYVIGACFAVLESNWLRYGVDNFSQLEISKGACIIITGYYGSLRGEEIGKGDLGSMRKHWKEAFEHLEYPHIPLILAGRFKGEI